MTVIGEVVSSEIVEPHNIFAEQSVLGSIIIEPQLISKVKNKITPDHFFNISNKIVFEKMLELYNQSIAIDLTTISHILDKDKNLQYDISISYITSLSTVVPTTNNIEYYLNILIENYIRRKGINLLNNMREKLYTESILELEDDIIEFKSLITNRGNIEELYIDASKIKKDACIEEFISTGFNQLDNMLKGGLKCTSLTILTGEPGSGKSTIINQILAGIISDGYATFLYSGELPSRDLLKWFNITIANKNHIVNKGEDVTEYSWNMVSKWIENKLIIYDDDSVADKRNILLTIEHLAINKNIKVFILDNLMTFDIDDENGQQYQNQKKLCLELKVLAKKYGIAIILVAHPKKPSSNEKPTMYDVSGASEIVGIADTVIRTMRPKNDNEDSKILLLKNRWGGIIDRVIRVKFDDTRKRFYSNKSELERDYGYDLNNNRL